MKIYSWNMLYRNEELDRAFSFIEETDFDIFCLQEVPDDFLSRLKTLPYKMVSAVDMEKQFPSALVCAHNVILSRFPISSSSAIPFKDAWNDLPLRTRIFTRLMRPFHFAEVRGRHGIVARLEVQGAPLCIFNLHLILAHPKVRLKEFEEAMLHHTGEVPSLVCGDFNSIESWHMAILNWVLGGKVCDTLFYTRERLHLEKRFTEYELTNALRGQTTHAFAQSQLDHILVSKHFSLISAHVIPNRYGSDHHPIFVEIT
jgi:endonuclease/exonuclease/phosphatase family metal-dependent hydrolase